MSSNFKFLQEGTFAMLDLWMYNFSRNMQDIIKADSVRMLNPLLNSSNITNHNPKGTAIVIGAGPSVTEKNHLEMLIDSKYQGAIICTDKMLVKCLKNGITPDRFKEFFVISIDPYLDTELFYKDPIIKEFNGKINAIMSTCVSPSVIENCKYNETPVYWFHPLIDDFRKPDSINKIMNIMAKGDKNPKGLPGLQTGGNVGTTGWVFSWTILGKAATSLIGMNLGYNENDKIEETQHFKELLKITDNDVEASKKHYRVIENKELNCKVLIDPVFDFYREAFCDLVTRTPKWVKTINSTEGGSIFGENIELMKFKQFLNRFSK